MRGNRVPRKYSDSSGLVTLYRATGCRGRGGRSPVNLGRRTWWAETEEEALAYTEPPQSFGGPCLYSGRFSDRHVLDLVGLSQAYEDNFGQEIAHLASELADNDEELYDDLIGRFGQWEYSHEVIDQELTQKELSFLTKQYDWIVIVDSYPENAITWFRLSPIPEKERRSIKKLGQFHMEYWE